MIFSFLHFYETRCHSFAVQLCHGTGWQNSASSFCLGTEWQNSALSFCHSPEWQNSATSFRHGPVWQDSASSHLPRRSAKGDLERSSKDQARQCFAQRPQTSSGASARTEQDIGLLTISALAEGDSFGQAKQYLPWTNHLLAGSSWNTAERINTMNSTHSNLWNQAKGWGRAF